MGIIWLGKFLLLFSSSTLFNGMATFSEEFLDDSCHAFTILTIGLYFVHKLTERTDGRTVGRTDGRSDNPKT